MALQTQAETRPRPPAVAWLTGIKRRPIRRRRTGMGGAEGNIHSPPPRKRRDSASLSLVPDPEPCRSGLRRGGQDLARRGQASFQFGLRDARWRSRQCDEGSERLREGGLVALRPASTVGTCRRRLREGVVRHLCSMRTLFGLFNVFRGEGRGQSAAPGDRQPRGQISPLITVSPLAPRRSPAQRR